jgi:hypothetical protein
MKSTTITPLNVENLYYFTDVVSVAVESATTAVESVVTAVESVVVSVFAPPHAVIVATNATIANTFFIFNCFVLYKYYLIDTNLIK